MTPWFSTKSHLIRWKMHLTAPAIGKHHTNTQTATNPAGYCTVTVVKAVTLQRRTAGVSEKQQSDLSKNWGCSCGHGLHTSLSLCLCFFFFLGFLCECNEEPWRWREGKKRKKAAGSEISDSLGKSPQNQPAWCCYWRYWCKGQFCAASHLLICPWLIKHQSVQQGSCKQGNDMHTSTHVLFDSEICKH